MNGVASTQIEAGGGVEHVQSIYVRLAAAAPEPVVQPVAARPDDAVAIVDVIEVELELVLQAVRRRHRQVRTPRGRTPAPEHAARTCLYRPPEPPLLFCLFHRPLSRNIVSASVVLPLSLDLVSGPVRPCDPR